MALCCLHAFGAALLVGAAPAGVPRLFRWRSGTPGAAADEARAVASTAAVAPEFDLGRAREECGKITSCYCTRGTSCGWCGSAHRAMLGKSNGPIGEVCADDWVAWSKDCPKLLCTDDGWRGEVAWWMSCSWLPMLCLLAFLLSLIWRRSLRARHMLSPDELAEMNLITFETGQARVARGYDDDDAAEFGSKRAERVVMEFFGPKRSLEAFRKGEARLPTIVSRPYELSLSDLSCRQGEIYERSRVGPHRISVTLRVAMQWRTSLGGQLPMATWTMFVSSVYLMFLRNAARTFDESTYVWVTFITHEIGAVVSPLNSAVAMLVSFYALNRINWFITVLMRGHICQGRAQDVGLLGGCLREDTEEGWQARYMLFRYLVLKLFFAFQPFTPSFRFAGFKPLIHCGLLLPEEAQTLGAAQRGPAAVIEAWLAHWIEANLDTELRQNAYATLREYRDATQILEGLVDQRAPVSFESLLFLAVHALVIIIPFSPSSLRYDDRQAVMDGSHIATVLGVGIICAFYRSLIHMLRHVQAPYDNIGAPNDALNPVALLNSTERKLRDYLTQPFPPALRPMVERSRA